ncbi:MAG: FAD-dependent oxidoreductase, partial [Bacteroidia bacterium]
MKIAVIGGGAAGFFAAIHAASANKTNEVTIYEKTGKLLTFTNITADGLPLQQSQHTGEVVETG